MAKEITEKEKLRLPFRGRGLIDFEKTVTSIRNIIESSKIHPLRILEIGCGFGQLLLDLSIAFGNKVELHGINLESDSINIERTLRVGKYKNKNLGELNANNCDINFIFCDAGEHIPFRDNFFDLIVSQAAIVYVPDKSKLIQEINRVLKNDGNGYLWAGFENNGSEVGYWSTLEIYRDEVIVPLLGYFEQFENIHYSFEDGKSNLHISKSDFIKMNIEFVSASNLELINPKYFGFKSIYVEK